MKKLLFILALALGVQTSYLTTTGYIVLDKSELDTFSGDGSGETGKLQNVLDKAVKDYFEILDPSETITIN